MDGMRAAGTMATGRTSLLDEEGGLLVSPGWLGWRLFPGSETQEGDHEYEHSSDHTNTADGLRLILSFFHRAHRILLLLDYS
jgi:hypothetical protein